MKGWMLGDGPLKGKTSCETLLQEASGERFEWRVEDGRRVKER